MRAFFAAAVIAFAAGCAGDTPELGDSATSAATLEADSTPTLYDRLGGMPTIRRVVDDLVENAAGDQRIRRFFERIRGDTASIRALKDKIADQLCEGSGGPCSYSGLDMRSAHLGMNLSDADFDAMIENLVVALDSAGVAQHEKDEILAVVAPMRAQIVTRR